MEFFLVIFFLALIIFLFWTLRSYGTNIFVLVSFYINEFFFNLELIIDDLAKIISEAIIETNQSLIFLVPTGSQMEKAGKKLGIKVAAEIFADRNYEDNGNLISRSKKMQ